MAFATGGKGGAQSDINVTPLVDVVLVLLIIFMVVTPLLQKSLEAEIPDQDAPPSPPDPTEPIQVVISVKRDGTYLNLDKVTDEELATRLEGMMKSRAKEKRLAFVTGEDDLAFGAIAHVMDIARGAKVEHVGIIDPLQ